MSAQGFVFANPQLHTLTNVDMKQRDGRYVCGISSWFRDHTWLPDVFLRSLSNLCMLGSANAHEKFRQNFTQAEYPGGGVYSHANGYEFQRKGNYAHIFLFRKTYF
jgi:hypothetical protein